MIEKLSKYKDLGIEISTIWGLKTETVSVVIGALGQVKKGLGKYVEKNSRKHQYRGTPKNQPFGYSPYFTKSAVYQLNNDTPPAAPKETGCFSEPWTVQTAKEEKENNNKIMNKKIMTMNGELHPKGDVDRLYVTRMKGGRGLISCESCISSEKNNLG